MLRSATLSSITAMPAPSAAVAVSTETANAREPAGISSTAMMLITSVSAVENARANVWLTPSHARVGQSAPVAVSAQPTTAEKMSTHRRPRRSARATMASASSAPTRVAASITPTAPSVTPKSCLK